MTLLLKTAIILLLFAWCGTASPPRIDQHPNNIIVNISDPVTLECRASGDPKPKITWYKEGQLLNIERIDQLAAVAAASNNLRNKYTLIHDSSLFIFSAMLGKANKTDNGVYFCRADNEHGHAMSNNASILITYLKDDFREMPKSRQVNAGIRVSMDCRAPRGVPEPIVWWEMNGVRFSPTSTSLTNEFAYKPSPYHTIYANGTLVISNTSINDNGEYVCVAKNEAGERRSAPAHLNVFEKPSFLIKPENVKYELNSRVEMKCQAEGFPKPLIEWRKENSVDNIPTKALIRDNLLIIPYAQLEDEGEYQCVATNQLASIETKAYLAINEKPKFTKIMSNVTIGIESKSIIIECNARGKPQPVIYWAKSSQPSNANRQADSMESSGASPQAATTQDDFIILENGNLFIERLSKKYEGTYLCQASNEYGNIETKTYLKVKPIQTKPPPIIVYGPQNQTIPINTQATLECLTSAGFSLNTKDSHSSYSNNNNHHRSSSSLLSSSLYSNDKIVITWTKGGQELISNQLSDIASISLSTKYKIAESGSLEINSVHKSDSGIYKCIASNSYGQSVSMPAFLNVENPNNQFVEFQRNHETTALPSAPAQPIISAISSTSLILSWQPSSHSGHSPLKSYTIEFFSPEWSTKTTPTSMTNSLSSVSVGWTMLSENIAPNVNSFIVENLQPDTYYMFLVRARNEQGFGPPSQVSDLVKTTVETQMLLRNNKDSSDLLEKALTGEIIQLNESPDVLSSTSINITWKIYKSAFLIEGFYIKYKPIGSKEYSVDTLTENRYNHYVIKNLNKFTTYEILVEPFTGAIRGSESNVVQAKTKEDVPSQSPLNLIVEVETLNSLSIKWQPLPLNQMNGIILGYKINCMANETKFSINLNTNATSRAIILGNLITGMKYCIKVAAFTKIGTGPFTLAKCVEMTDANIVVKTKWSDDNNQVPKIVATGSISDQIKYYIRQPWFISMLTIICLVSVGLILYCIWQTVKRIFFIKHAKHNNKYLSSSSDNGSLNLTHKMDNGNRYKLVSDNNNQSIWLDTLYSSNHSNQDCCCVPDLPHQLFVQNTANGNLQLVHDLNNHQLSTLDKRNIHNLSLKSKFNNSIDQTKTINNKHINSLSMTSSTTTNPASSSSSSSSAPQYAEIYASNMQSLGANPYATTGLFLNNNKNNDSINNTENNYNDCEDDQIQSLVSNQNVIFLTSNNSNSNILNSPNNNLIRANIINSNNNNNNTKYSSYTIKLLDDKLNINNNNNNAESNIKANEMCQMTTMSHLTLADQKKLLKYLQSTQSQTNTPRIQFKNMQNRVKSVESNQQQQQMQKTNDSSSSSCCCTTSNEDQWSQGCKQSEMSKSQKGINATQQIGSTGTAAPVPLLPLVPPPSLASAILAATSQQQQQQHLYHIQTQQLNSVDLNKDTKRFESSSSGNNQSPVHYNSPWNMVSSNETNLNSILLNRLVVNQNNNNNNNTLSSNNRNINNNLINRIYQQQQQPTATTFTSQQYVNRVLNNNKHLINLEIHHLQQQQQLQQQPDYLSISPEDEELNEINGYFPTAFVPISASNNMKNQANYLSAVPSQLNKGIFFKNNDNLINSNNKMINSNNQISSSYDSSNSSTNQNTCSSSSDSSIISSSNNSSNCKSQISDFQDDRYPHEMHQTVI